MTVLTYLLLITGLAAYIQLQHRVLKAATFPYWSLSWTGQSFALPLAIVSGITLLYNLMTDQASFLTVLVSITATLIFALVHRRNHRMGGALKRQIRQHMAASEFDTPVPWHAGVHPLGIKKPGVKRIRDIAYGEEGERNLLDIYLPESMPNTPCPIVIQIHGGAWVFGKKDNQGLPLLYHMAQKGWMGVAINYRLGPKWRFPAMLTDVLKAIAWVKSHAGDYGGDPAFIALTGGSAGGHLTTLAALLPNQDDLQPGFEDADTRVSAAVPLYGRYDFLDRAQLWGKGSADIIKFMAEKVMPCYPEQDYALWERGSPVAQVHSGAPPFLVIHGTHDSMIPVEEARNFSEELRRQAGNDVIYAELQGAQHAFDFVGSALTAHTVVAIETYLREQYRLQTQ